MIGRPSMDTSADAGSRLKLRQRLMDVFSGIAEEVLRLGIARGGYTAYVEVADSGLGFRYWVTRDGVCLSEREAPDFPTARPHLHGMTSFAAQSAPRVHRILASFMPRSCL
jgi:hypothetical protein